MSEPRKTLRLPVRADEARPVNPARKPVRGSNPGLSSGKRAPAKREETSTESAKPEKIDWRKRSAEKMNPPAKPSGRKSPRALQSASEPEAAPPRVLKNPDRDDGVRISKLMSERGLCSRREADEFITRGWVYVDGERISTLGARAALSANITLDEKARAAQRRLMTILLHKPVGYVSGQPEPGCQPAVMLIRPENQRRTPDTPLFHASHLNALAPAGRLDVDSTGLLILTQDGRVARRLIGENSKVEKEYLVRVEGRLSDEGLEKLNHGLTLDGKALKPARVEWLNEDQLRFILNEGRKRQIRRMCELVGLRVTGLKRVRIGKIRLGDLPSGQWRYLRENETF